MSTLTLHERHDERDAGDRRLRVLGRSPGPDVAAALSGIEALPGVEHVLALPDLHLKPRMETPSSLAVATRGVLVPEFTSVAINDGMGVVVTDLDRHGLTPARIERLLARVAANAAAHPLDVNRYSLRVPELRAAMRDGAAAVLERYGLGPEVLDRVHERGRMPVPGSPWPWEESVPAILARTPFACAETGLNFGGNHFLEVQAVGEVLDRRAARAFGLEPGRVVVMYHLGPGPFSGTLLHHYSRRDKVDLARAPVYFLSRLVFHARRRWRRDRARVWREHFRRNRWTLLPEDSEGGLAFRQALAIATNVGFAYRMATVAAIRDALREALFATCGAELLCDVPHNFLAPEDWGGTPRWVARHNASPVVPGMPTIVAGDHDVPSMLAIGAPDAPPPLRSSDHGAGHVIAEWRRAGRLGPGSGETLKLRMTRGRGARVLARSRAQVRDPAPVDALVRCLESHGILRPVARLHPLGTLKN